MATPASEVQAVIEGQHPDAGVLVLDCHDGEGSPTTLGSRDAHPDVEDAPEVVVLMNAPPVLGDARPRDQD